MKHLGHSPLTAKAEEPPSLAISLAHPESYHRVWEGACHATGTAFRGLCSDQQPYHKLHIATRAHRARRAVISQRYHSKARCSGFPCWEDRISQV